MKKFLALTFAILFVPTVAPTVLGLDYPFDWFYLVTSQSAAICLCGIVITNLLQDETAKLQAALFAVFAGALTINHVILSVWMNAPSIYTWFIAFILWLVIAYRTLSRTPSRYISHENDLEDLVYIVAKRATAWQSLALWFIGRPPFVSVALYCNGVTYGFKKGVFQQKNTIDDNSVYIRTNRMIEDEKEWLNETTGTRWSLHRNCFTTIESRYGKLETHLKSLDLKAMEL